MLGDQKQPDFKTDSIPQGVLKQVCSSTGSLTRALARELLPFLSSFCPCCHQVCVTSQVLQSQFSGARTGQNKQNSAHLAVSLRDKAGMEKRARFSSLKVERLRVRRRRDCWATQGVARSPTGFRVGELCPWSPGSVRRCPRATAESCCSFAAEQNTENTGGKQNLHKGSERI